MIWLLFRRTLRRLGYGVRTLELQQLGESLVIVFEELQGAEGLFSSF